MEGGNDGGEGYGNPNRKCGIGSESDSCRFNCDCETLIHFWKSIKKIYILIYFWAALDKDFDCFNLLGEVTGNGGKESWFWIYIWTVVEANKKWLILFFVIFFNYFLYSSLLMCWIWGHFSCYESRQKFTFKLQTVVFSFLVLEDMQSYFFMLNIENS